MKAISLWQPWASAMAMGLKSIETRHWYTSHRGPLAIHAAKRWTGNERDFAEAMRMPADLPLGAIVAVGEIVRVEQSHMLRPYISETERQWGDYANGRYGWVLERIVALSSPIPFRGAQGFFDVPDELVGALAPSPRQASLL